MNNKKFFLAIFIGCLAATILINPLLSSIGVPSFNDILVTIFGDRNPWALAVLLPIIFLPLYIGVQLSKKNHSYD